VIGNRVAVIVGGLGIAAVAVAKTARRRRAAVATAPAAGPAGADPRAAELRRKLDEVRAVAEDRDEFEAAETPIDQAEAPEDVDERRRRIHDEGRAAAEEMRGDA
jgi:hypothetical protein